MKKLRDHFRKENIIYISKLFLTMLGFLLSNVGIGIHISESLTSWLFWICLLFCIVFLFFFLLLIYRKFLFYYGIVQYLQNTDTPYYVICTYIAKIRKSDHKKVNKFKISKITISYDIVNVAPAKIKKGSTHCNNVEFVATYCVDAKNTNTELSEIYFTLLTNKRGCTHILPQYKFKNDAEWSTLQFIPYYGNKENLSLWRAVKSGTHIARNDLFSYEFKFTFYETSISMLEKNFLIDPSNYSGDIDRVDVVVKSNDDNFDKLLNPPLITKYNNGLLFDQRNSTLLLNNNSSSNFEYSTYYSADHIKPDCDSLFVVSLKPKATLHYQELKNDEEYEKCKISEGSEED